MDLPELESARGWPVHQQIAAALRSAIDAGSYPPGGRVPGENAIMKRYGVARWTARQALAELSAAGYIRTVPKVGTFVCGEQHLVRTPRRYRRGTRSAPFVTDARDAGLRAEVEARSEVVSALAGIAERLSVSVDTPVMRTQYRFLAGGRPVQASVSYEPHAAIAGTPIEYPERGEHAGAGVVARYDAIGVHIDHVSEEVTQRPPRGTEADDLDVPRGAHVFLIHRTFTSKGRPIETADIVIPSDRYSLLYSFPIPDEDDEPTAT